MSDQPLFHLTPRELYDLFCAACDWPVRQEIRKLRLVDLMFVYAMHKRAIANNPVYDRDELLRAIEVMFEGVGHE